MTVVYLNHDPLDAYMSRQLPPDNPLAETKSLGLSLGKEATGFLFVLLHLCTTSLNLFSFFISFHCCCYHFPFHFDLFPMFFFCMPIDLIFITLFFICALCGAVVDLHLRSCVPTTTTTVCFLPFLYLARSHVGLCMAGCIWRLCKSPSHAQQR